MRKIGLILFLGLLVWGRVGAVASVQYPPEYRIAAEQLFVAKIKSVMHSVGFNIVEEKLESGRDMGLNGSVFVFFRIESYPEVLKKYFQRTAYRFFSVEADDTTEILYLRIRGWYEDSDKWPLAAFANFYSLSLDKKKFSEWRKIIESEDMLVFFRNELVLGLTGIDCVSRPEIVTRPAGFSKKPLVNNNSVLGGSVQKFSPLADNFLSLLFKEMRSSYALRFTVDETLYPNIELKVFKFPKDLERFASPKFNRVVLEHGSYNGKEWLKIANMGRLNGEVAFFTVELSDAFDITQKIKKTAQDIFNGLYFPY